VNVGDIILEDEGWAGLLYFRAYGWVKVHQVHLATLWRCYARRVSHRSAKSNKAASWRSVTSGLNFTQNHRFEFAVAAAAGAVD
jgi:hypothetical protein